MNGTRHTLCVGIVMAALVALMPEAFGLQASETFTETVPPSGEATVRDKDVVNLVGIQTYELKAPGTKVIDEKSVVWSGVPGAQNSNGQMTATFIDFDSDNCQYTVTAKGHFEGTQGQPGEGFELHFKGAVYKPLLVITDPTADKGAPAGGQNTFQFCAQMKAQYSGRQEETAWAGGIVYEVQITDTGGTQVDSEKAYFTSYPGSSSNCDALDGNGQVQENWVVTQAALPGEVYCIKLVISAQTDFAATSNKVTVFGLTFDSASPQTIPLLPGGGEMATDVTFGYTIVPNDYQPTTQEIHIMQAEEKKHEVPGQNGTATWTKMAFPAGAYNSKAVLNEGIAGEESVSTESFDLLIFGIKLLQPEATQSSTVTTGDNVDCAAELLPGNLVPDAPGAKKWHLDGDDIGSFQDDTSLVTKLNTTDPGQAEVYAEVTKNGVTAESERHTLNVVGVDGIEIRVSGSWKEAPVDLILLAGTKYTFRGVLKGADTWPEGEPTWTWGNDDLGTSETLELTFGAEAAGKELKVECGQSSTSILIEVIEPTPYRMEYAGANRLLIVDKQNKWQGDENGLVTVNDPGCFQQGKTTGAIVNFYHEKALTFPTKIQVRGDVHYLDEYVTGKNYVREYMTVQTWPSNSAVTHLSENTAEDEIENDETVDMTWKYQVKAGDDGTDEWVATYELTGLKYYLVWGAPCFTEAEWCNAAIDFKGARISFLTGLADGEGTPAGIADELGDNLTAHARFSSGWSMYPGGPVQLRHPWHVLDNSSQADCATLSALMQWSMELIGVPGAKRGAVYARHANWNGLYVEGVPSEDHMERHLLWGDRLGIMMLGWNNFEGTCRFGSTYYLGGLDATESSPYGVLTNSLVAGSNTSSGHHQAWINEQAAAVPYPDGQP